MKYEVKPKTKSIWKFLNSVFTFSKIKATLPLSKLVETNSVCVLTKQKTKDNTKKYFIRLSLLVNCFMRGDTHIKTDNHR